MARIALNYVNKKKSGDLLYKSTFFFSSTEPKFFILLNCFVWFPSQSFIYISMIKRKMRKRPKWNISQTALAGRNAQMVKHRHMLQKGAVGFWGTEAASLQHVHLSVLSTVQIFPPPLQSSMKSVCKKNWAFLKNWTRLKMSNVRCRHSFISLSFKLRHGQLFLVLHKCRAFAWHNIINQILKPGFHQKFPRVF